MTSTASARIATGIAMVLLGLLLVPAVDRLAEVVRATYDEASPIATVTAERTDSPPGETRLRMRSIKHRPGDLLMVQAFEREADGWKRIAAARVDGAPVAAMPPGMVMRESLWRVWPTSERLPLLLILVYDVDGRVVRQQVDVP